jgi:hypothetical protein
VFDGPSYPGAEPATRFHPRRRRSCGGHLPGLHSHPLFRPSLLMNEIILGTSPGPRAAPRSGSVSSSAPRTICIFCYGPRMLGSSERNAAFPPGSSPPALPYVGGCPFTSPLRDDRGHQRPVLERGEERCVRTGRIGGTRSSKPRNWGYFRLDWHGKAALPSRAEPTEDLARAQLTSLSKCS